MAFTEVTTNATDIKKEKGKPFIGYFDGSQKIQTKIGEQVIWKFIDEHGITFGIYGFTNLNMKMENISEGLLCRVTYLGTKNMKTKFGMKDVHQVKVEVDSSSKNNSEPEPEEPFDL